MKKISIMMNCYNGEKDLRRAIDSVYKQTYQDWEIVFIDNCSTDNSADIAKSYGEKVRYLKTPQNIPLFAARNFALENIDSEYLCFLDTDDYWLGSKLQKQIEFLEKNPEIDLLCTDYLYNYENYKGFKYLKATIYYLRKLIKRRLTKKSSSRNTEQLLKLYDINLQTVMVKSNFLKKIKFDSNLNLFGDADIFLRLSKQEKINLYYYNITTSVTTVHPNQLSRSSKEKWLKEFLYLKENIYAKLFTKSEMQLFDKLITENKG